MCVLLSVHDRSHAGGNYASKSMLLSMRPGNKKIALFDDHRVIAATGAAPTFGCQLLCAKLSRLMGCVGATREHVIAVWVTLIRKEAQMNGEARIREGVKTDCANWSFLESTQWKGKKIRLSVVVHFSFILFLPCISHISPLLYHSPFTYVAAVTNCVPLLNFEFKRSFPALNVKCPPPDVPENCVAAFCFSPKSDCAD